MEFRLLGPLETEQAGAPVPLGGPRQRALLAALLLQANSVATIDYLTAAVWDVPPVAAASNIRTFIAQLRRRFAEAGDDGGRLATTTGGYELTVHPAELDLLIFQDVAGRGAEALRSRDAAAAAEHLRQALDLWRGQPLTGDSLSMVLQSRVASLTEQRLTLAEQ